ncbi:hypothetical protein ASG01_14210 [Chryseobacterium sp. Leaf180]|uniref:hypothetical protein n=1 Tax=Chryseobacterium sp. Leaf180 TaxID=1736289 RepID=UPI0006FE6DAB|nr:hypothetical protein [Chryseobacterium sp. Leaf180]KQR91516.1 hypothetical protein ASG01_14210 [Chryseobacterium sp. Leaf180]
MDFSILPSHLHKIAESANFIIKNRYGLTDGLVEQEIEPHIPLRPTLHWKTPTQYIVCEVAERPFPVSIKQQFADIVSTGVPIRIIVAYPKENDLSGKDYSSDIKESKKFGIGYMSVNETKVGDIEYQGISLAQHITQVDLTKYIKTVKPYVSEAYEHYMLKGDPDVGLQKIGQVIESMLYNVAVQAKKDGSFVYIGFKPPKYIAQALLISELIKENILDISILVRCKDFANDRNAVSHKAKSRKKAAEIEAKMKENFIIGTRILQDLPLKIKDKGYKVKI